MPPAGARELVQRVKDERGDARVVTRLQAIVDLAQGMVVERDLGMALASQSLLRLGNDGAIA